MSDDKLQLTRRRVLGGLGGIGAGAALGGTGTMAFLSDTEKSKNNMMTAGTLDLKLDWFTFYQGEEYQTDYQEKTNDPGPVFELGDVKPGDYGCGVISVHVDGNPAHVWFRTKNAKHKENGRKEPERKVDDSRYKGELAKKVKFVAAPLGCFEDYNGESTAKDELPHGSEERPSMDDWTTDEANADGDNDKRYCIFKGTLKEALHEFKCGKYLDVHGKNKTCLFGFCWWIPKRVGNEIQSDKVKFDMEFYAEQKRHNEYPENPKSPWYDGDLEPVSDHSMGNEFNTERGGHPFIRWDIDGHEITYKLYNQTDEKQPFDYRVDGESGHEDQWSDDKIREGPLEGHKFGKVYNTVTVPPKSMKKVKVKACEKTAVAIHRGPEQKWYVPWIRFETEE